MASRLQLDSKLRELCDHVYFQPPETIKMVYPCIVYKKSRGDHIYANNSVYRFYTEYELTAISRDPDTTIIEELLGSFSMIQFNRRFVVDNLYHDVFILYF